jgi:MFS family permease
MIASLKFQVGLLAGLQALLLTNNATLIAVNALAGLQLADNKLLATLPVTGYVIGGAFWSMPAAYLMKRFGRRVGQSIGAVAAIIGALIAGYAMVIASLWLLCFATFVSGLYNAFGVSLRFAAADVADAYRPSFKARAISLVLTGGIVGGIIGPEIARWSRTALPQEFAGTYLMLGVFALASLALVQLLRMPSRLDKSSSAMPARSLAEILRQPAAVIAIASAAFGYGVMNLLMVATPLAMEVCSLPFDSAVFVLQWHIVGMFGPGLVTGSIISRVGVFPVIAAGAALMLGCVVVALSGVELMHFTAALFLLGVGWNFLYTGGTTLLTTAYRPQEKNKVQGFMDLCVFGVMVSSSASSGALLFVNGWSVLNLISLPFVLIVLVGAIWAASRLGWRVGQVRAGAA